MIPEGWQVQNLADVALIILGQSPPSSACNEEVQGYPFYQGNADFGYKHPLPQRWIESPPKVAKKDDILISVRAPVGELNIANTDCCIGRGVGAIRPLSANRNFIYYTLLNSRNSLASVSQGSTFDAINGNELRSLSLLMPPLPEQKKIATILGSVDDTIQATQAVIDQTRKVKQGLMQQLLTRGIGHTRFKQTEIGKIPEGWEVRNLDEVSKIIDSLHKTPIFSDAGIPMVRVTEIKGGLLNLKRAKKVSEVVYAEFSKNYVPKRGDIVLSRVGTYGASSFVDTDEIFCMGQNTVVISPLIEGIFIFQQLQSSWIRDQIENGVVGSSQKTVSLRILRKLKILIPTFAERMKISEVLTNVDEKIRSEENILKQYFQLKRGLMQDLLTGRIRVKPDEVNTT